MQEMVSEQRRERYEKQGLKDSEIIKRENNRNFDKFSEALNNPNYLQQSIETDERGMSR